MRLLKKREALCLELDNRSSLGYCRWHLGILAEAQEHPRTARKYLEGALEIFTKLEMSREEKAVRAELKRLPDAQRYPDRRQRVELQGLCRQDDDAWLT
jgi:hypothetical protein